MGSFAEIPKTIMKKALLLVAIIPLLMAGCQTQNNPPTSNAPLKPLNDTLNRQVGDAQTSIQNVQAPLTESGQHIENAKISVLTSNQPSATVGELDAAKTKLDEGQSLLTKASVSIATAVTTATQAVVAATQADAQIKSLQTKNTDLQNKLNTQSAWVFKLLLGIAAGLIVAGIGICVASMMIGFASLKIGGLVSAGGVALLVLTLTLQQYEKQLVIGCGILLLAVAAYFCWQLFVSAKANKELVQFGEAVKTKADGTLKTQLFGDNNSPVPNSLADSIQSDSTQQIVSNLRTHLKVAAIKKGG